MIEPLVEKRSTAAPAGALVPTNLTLDPAAKSRLTAELTGSPRSTSRMEPGSRATVLAAMEVETATSVMPGVVPPKVQNPT